MQKNFYLTTTLPYINADPHLGFALEIIQADVIARYQRLLGKQVFFNTGTDEHGQKIWEKALENKIDVQTYCDQYAKKFENLKQKLNLSFDYFIRTTDENHIKAAQHFWKLCAKDIYKKLYKIKYCVGCELEKTDSELVNGKCPLHPNQELEGREEINYFFRFSKYQNKLLELYQKNPHFVLPSWRQKEITNFVKNGLEDFSISRVKAKMPWGIAVPDDEEQVMYVWFDALINYISCLGWPNEGKYQDFWPGIQLAGKDNLRQQSAMWQAMLMSAGLPNSTQILIHGFITAGGQKMSKSLGNVIDPIALVNQYGTDAVRYYLLKEISPFEDGDFTLERFKEIYNSDLANGLGNLASRIIAMAQKYFDLTVPKPISKAQNHELTQGKDKYNELQTWKDVEKNLEKFNFNEAINSINKFISSCDKYIAENKPWELIKKDQEKTAHIVYGLLDALFQITWMIYPFLPQTSLKIAKALAINNLLKQNPILKDSFTNIQPGTKINKINPLFPRLEN